MTQFFTARVPIIVLMSLSMMTNVASSLRYTYDLEIRYFSDANLVCDHPKLNITQRNDVLSLQWIFEDGSLVTPKSYLNSKKYIFQGLSNGVVGASVPNSRYDGYNLTLLEVDDDVFGYYTCIVLFSGNPDHPKLAAIRYGLNVDGADFSELLDEYKHNAMVGGIAAGITFVLIGICCFVWYYYCNEKNPEDLEEGDVDGDGSEISVKGEKTDNGGATFHNEAFKGDKSDFENDNTKDNGLEVNVKL